MSIGRLQPHQIDKLIVGCYRWLVASRYALSLLEVVIQDRHAKVVGDVTIVLVVHTVNWADEFVANVDLDHVVLAGQLAYFDRVQAKCFLQEALQAGDLIACHGSLPRRVILARASLRGSTASVTQLKANEPADGLAYQFTGRSCNLDKEFCRSTGNCYSAFAVS